MKIFTLPLQPKFYFWKKKGGPPQIRQKFNQLGFFSNFQGNLRQQKDCDWRWSSLPPSPQRQNMVLGKKGETSPNQSKILSTQILLSFQGLWLEVRFFKSPPLIQNSILSRNGGGIQNQGKIQPSKIWLRLIKVCGWQWNPPPLPKLDFRQIRGDHPKPGKTTLNPIWVKLSR